MDRSEWIDRLEGLHFRIREGEPVADPDRAWYLEARRALVETALDVQARALTHESMRRRHIRIARSAQVLLEARGWHCQTITADLGAGGFAVYMEAPPPVDDWIRATLLLPGGSPVIATVAVADAREAGGLVRIAFSFSQPTEEVRRRVEDYLLDSVLEQLVFWQDVLDKLQA